MVITVLPEHQFKQNLNLREELVPALTKFLFLFALGFKKKNASGAVGARGGIHKGAGPSS